METEWRCTRCRKLLGALLDGRLHLKFARGHEYLVALPAIGVCRGCGSLNELKGTAAGVQPASGTGVS